ncbi:hypothetical protein HHI36_007639 [Cryptolaemus montrouzieri]|uniref:Uncharacterized protein n=1 Tax=Cryptolaemus montrouzieri TaxID=559131 RepID=A0ABD2MQ66_9CUCU
MCSGATNFPPSTYSSNFLLNAISEDEEGRGNNNTVVKPQQGFFSCFSKEVSINFIKKRKLYKPNLG